ncbi:unnamed protein product [Symbiodinium natans]|uniref:Uncharacterized protein n=1 Tax=Symbiodinium natans TaxID=878477 RepID=A0A812SL06_9DINO|nr:unnamed protein product [Symbiodinium natans]
MPQKDAAQDAAPGQPQPPADAGSAPLGGWEPEQEDSRSLEDVEQDLDDLAEDDGGAKERPDGGAEVLVHEPSQIAVPAPDMPDEVHQEAATGAESAAPALGKAALSEAERPEGAAVSSKMADVDRASDRRLRAEDGADAKKEAGESADRVEAEAPIGVLHDVQEHEQQQVRASGEGTAAEVAAGGGDNRTLPEEDKLGDEGTSVKIADADSAPDPRMRGELQRGGDGVSSQEDEATGGDAVDVEAPAVTGDAAVSSKMVDVERASDPRLGAEDGADAKKEDGESADRVEAEAPIGVLHDVQEHEQQQQQQQVRASGEGTAAEVAAGAGSTMPVRDNRTLPEEDRPDDQGVSMNIADADSAPDPRPRRELQRGEGGVSLQEDEATGGDAVDVEAPAVMHGSELPKGQSSGSKEEGGADKELPEPERPGDPTTPEPRPGAEDSAGGVDVEAPATALDTAQGEEGPSDAVVGAATEHGDAEPRQEQGHVKNVPETAGDLA